MSRFLYNMYQGQSLLAAPSRTAARMTADVLDLAPPAVRRNPVLRRVQAASTVLAGARLTHRRPRWDVGEVAGAHGPLTIEESVADATAFGTLRFFAAADPRVDRDAVLLIAPMSGHFATMLSPTLQTLLRDHDVYVTDWHNARDIPLDEGRFGLEEYVDHLIRFLRVIGPDVHIMAVCQPCVPALAAVALLAADPEPLRPRSLTLMSGPIDTRRNPTKINDMADRRPIEWYRDRCVTVVPRPHRGAGRRVYPGFLQVSAFMSLNARRHLDSHVGMYRNLVAGQVDTAAQTKRFYEEYFAVLDVPAEFYLETVERIFMQHLLPLGRLTQHGRPVRPEAIEDTRVLTVEAERDDMCAVGQTEAAHDLLTGLSPQQRARHVQPGVGHYGIFNGRRWENEVYPVIQDFMAQS